MGAAVSGGASIGAAAGPLGAVAGAAAGVVVSVMSGGVPAMIRCTDPTALGLVLFDFNPDKITASRQPRGGNRPNHVGGSSGYILSQSDPAKLSLKGVIFTGETTKLRVDTLLAWTGPPAGLATMISAMAGIPISSNPPTVTFQWGPAAARLHVRGGDHVSERDLHALPHQRHP